MTNEEAIKLLTRLINKSKDGYEVQALNMAINALENQTSEDLISRKAVLDLAKDLTFEGGCKHRCVDVIKIYELPSYNSIKTELNGDLISRQAVLKILSENRFRYNIAQEGYNGGQVLWSENLYTDTVRTKIEKLPSAENNTKIRPMQVELEADGYADGELVYDYGKCPNCGWEFEEGDKDWKEPYCCHCGQKLKWFESEDNERMNYKLYKLLKEIPYNYSDHRDVRQEVIEDVIQLIEDLEEEKSEEE